LTWAASTTIIQVEDKSNTIPPHWLGNQMVTLALALHKREPHKVYLSHEVYLRMPQQALRVIPIHIFYLLTLIDKTFNFVLKVLFIFIYLSKKTILEIILTH